jgi:hypothetical protein
MHGLFFRARFMQQQHMHFTLRKFDASTIKDTSICVIIGKRNTGKSVLAKDIMFHKRHIPAGIVMSATEEGNSFYGSWVPDSFIYNDFDRGVIEKLIDDQKRKVREGVAQNLFLVLDDCMYDKRLLKEKCMRFLFMNGRHLKLFVMLTAQYCGDLPPDIRANIDYVFILRDNIIQNRERIFKNFMGLMPSFNHFCQLMDATTENYECLVLDNTSKSNNLSDCLFWYKAQPEHSFKMGSPSYWRFHQSTYNPRHDDDRDRDKGRAAVLRDPRKPRISITRLDLHPHRRRRQ